MGRSGRLDDAIILLHGFPGNCYAANMRGTQRLAERGLKFVSLAFGRRYATCVPPAPVRGLQPTAPTMRPLRDPFAVSFPKFRDETRFSHFAKCGILPFIE